jgi:hypothetical protein
MKLPGFTSEVLLDKKNRSYYMPANNEVTHSTHAVYLQLGIPLSVGQRPTGPSGPIGLPGQNCEEACWHVCAMRWHGYRGLAFRRCLMNCESTCTQY